MEKNCKNSHMVAVAGVTCTSRTRIILRAGRAKSDMRPKARTNPHAKRAHLELADRYAEMSEATRPAIATAPMPVPR